jgi:vacuolar-type H+-ATPase subunit H
VKVQAIIEELIVTVEEAKSMPLSQSCVINRQDVMGLLRQLEKSMPAEINQASALLNDRESVIQDARNESGRIIELAHAEAAVLVSQEQVYKSALAEVERLRTANDDEMARKRRELDDYIDAKLAAFEAALVKTLNAVQVGRERTAVRLASDVPPDTNHDPGNFFGDWADPRA